MPMGIKLGMGLPPPSAYTLPDGTEPLALADFKSGVFQIGGASYSFEDIVEPDATYGDWLPASYQPGVGLVDTDSTGKTSLVFKDDFASFVNNGCTIIPALTGQGSFQTDILLLPDFFPQITGKLFAVDNGVEPNVDPSVTLTIRDSEFNQLTDEDSGFSEELRFRAAFNLAPTRQAASLNGRPVITQDAADPGAAVNRAGFYVLGLTLESIAFYPLQDEGDLPTLSALS